MSDYDWDATFLALFERCSARYREGDHHFEGWYGESELAFLGSIGCGQREFFDFVEDHVREGEPGPGTALLVASVRRDYLREVMKGRKSGMVLDPATLPPKTAEFGGLVWLPRLIAKARAKLRGELDPDTMYGCGGDRAFFRRHRIAPADFLRAVWSAGDDDEAILAYVRRHSEA